MFFGDTSKCVHTIYSADMNKGARVIFSWHKSQGLAFLSWHKLCSSYFFI
jgi:hypothetical protein